MSIEGPNLKSEASIEKLGSPNISVCKCGNRKVVLNDELIQELKDKLKYIKLFPPRVFGPLEERGASVGDVSIEYSEKRVFQPADGVAFTKFLVDLCLKTTPSK